MSTQLNVDFKEKEAAKALGAQWDATNRTWFVPDGVPLQPFAKWLPASVAAALPATTEPGCSLTEYLARISAAVAKAASFPEWVRVEVSEVRERNHNVYLQLVDHGGDGQTQLARVTGLIWGSTGIVEKFCEATGSSLAAGIKLLVKVQAKYDPKFGLSLVISDIDPAYTLGDMAAKLLRIEQALKAEGVFARNKALPPPVEFTRVLVIAPMGAAGLGDFRRDADVLQQLGLAHFEYFEALFQGDRAPGEICEQIRIATEYAVIKPADVLVIIRGGGAVSDLHWLNDEDLARAVCTATLPVFTGIGHERDETILDRVACQRFDTPSKVIGHIVQRITGNAREAQEHYRAVCDAATRALDVTQGNAQRYLEQTQASARHQVDQQAQRAEALQQGVVTAAASAIEKADQATQHLHQNIGQTAQSQLNATDQRASRHFIELREAAARRLTTEQHSAETLHRAIGQLANQAVDRLAVDSAETLRVTRERCTVRLDRAEEQTRNLIEFTLGLGPDATLGRGYTIVRTLSGRVLANRADAEQESEIQIQFRDGHLTVKPQE